MQPSDEQYRTVTEYYRRASEGHVFIRETIAAFFATLGRRIQSLNHAPSILELGSHAGIITLELLERWPDAAVLVDDDDESLIAMSRRRLGERSVRYHTGSLRDVAQRLDLVASIARHHHLAHDYLSDLRHVMQPHTVYVLADELCPEYCHAEHAERVRRAELIHVVGGYVLTTRDEVRAFEDSGAIPAPAVAMERLRQRALWHWYRFVVDQAVELGYFDIAVGELQSTHDDLITGSAAEHKLSPLIVERQFTLAGFQMLSKHSIGPAEDPSRQSMFVYEFALA